MYQNASGFGQRFHAAQVAAAAPGMVPRLYKTGTDKGLHHQLCVVPIYNNFVNTTAQDAINTVFSACRVSNEWDVGRPSSLFNYFDYRKVEFNHLQPLGIFILFAAY
jgi:hypothetical protein